MRTIHVPENTTFREVFDREVDLSIVVGAGARVELVLVAIEPSAGRVRVVLEGAGAEAHLRGLFIAGAGERVSYHTEIEHLVPDCTSRQDFRGVASGDGHGLFEGLIRVAPAAQRTQAFQQSNNLIMSDLAVIEARPQLEIYADDVKCSHGATVGPLDAQALFYLRQRGLSEEEARRLQLQGFVNQIVSPDEMPEIAAAVARKIESL